MGLKIFQLGAERTKNEVDNKDRQKYNSIKISVQELCNKYIASGGVLTIEVSPDAALDFQQYTTSDDFRNKYDFSQHPEDESLYDIMLKGLVDI